MIPKNPKKKSNPMKSFAIPILQRTSALTYSNDNSFLSNDNPFLQNDNPFLQNDNSFLQNDNSFLQNDLPNDNASYPIDVMDYWNEHESRIAGSYDNTSLVDKQNRDYEEAMIQDIENRFSEMEQNEMKRLKEESWNEEQLSKALRLLPEEIGPYSIRISLRYHLKNRSMKRIEHGFPLSATMANLFDFIECKTFLPVGSSVQVFIPFPRKELKSSLKTLQEVFGCAVRALALHVDVIEEEV